MLEHGNVSVGTPGKMYNTVPTRYIQGSDAAGAPEMTRTIDANLDKEITTTFGMNLDTGNDFAIPVPVKARQQELDRLGVKRPLAEIYIRPDTVDALKEDAEEALRRQQPLVVYNHAGDAIGDIDPKVLLTILNKSATLPHPPGGVQPRHPDGR